MKTENQRWNMFRFCYLHTGRRSQCLTHEDVFWQIRSNAPLIDQILATPLPYYGLLRLYLRSICLCFFSCRGGQTTSVYAIRPSLTKSRSAPCPRYQQHADLSLELKHESPYIRSLPCFSSLEAHKKNRSYGTVSLSLAGITNALNLIAVTTWEMTWRLHRRSCGDGWKRLKQRTADRQSRHI